ncbi:MAG: DUF6624 domain-containing protein [Saprospiraceae bacterium]
MKKLTLFIFLVSNVVVLSQSNEWFLKARLLLSIEKSDYFCAIAQIDSILIQKYKFEKEFLEKSLIFDISYNSSKKVKSILANANKDDICSLKYLCYKNNTFSSFFSKLRCNNEKISHPKNTKILLTAFLKDQIVRGVDKKLLLDKYFNYNIKIDSTSLLSFTEEDNTKLLKKIINKFGFPRISQIGRDGMLAVFIIIQHSELEFQKQMLPFILKACQNKEMPKSHYALLSDRIESFEGRSQLYGTQFTFDGTGTLKPFPIKDSLTINLRRFEMELLPFEIYKEIINLKKYNKFQKN